MRLLQIGEKRERSRENVKRYIVMYFFQTIISVECYLFLVYVYAEREKKRERIQVYEDLVEVVYFFFEKKEEE